MRAAKGPAGGFNGVLTTGLTALRDAPAGMPLPLTQGYVTFGTDSGHDAAAYIRTDPAKFALNDEMFENFAYASYKKVKDVAHVLVQRYYLRKPVQQYFFGGSEGGREGLLLAQRFPREFDGIVSVVPVIHWNGLFNGFVNFIKPQYSGGVLSQAKTRLIANAVNDACDTLDGIADGVISNYLACPARFNVQSLRCPGGSDAGDACLSDAQIVTFNGAYAPTVLPFTLANGLTTYPGRLFGGEIQPNEGIAAWVSNGQVPGNPPVATDARAVIYGSSYARNVIARDPRLRRATVRRGSLCRANPAGLRADGCDRSGPARLPGAWRQADHPGEHRRHGPEPGGGHAVLRQRRRANGAGGR